MLTQDNGKQLDPTQFSVTQLRQACAENDVQYRQGNNSTPEFCLELFRRALVARDQVAWEALHSIYVPQVTRWVQAQLGNADKGQVEPLVNDALFRFWKAVTPQKFNSRLNHLGKLLQYLKTCAISCVIDQQRSSQRQRHQVALDEIAQRLKSKEPLVEMLLSNHLEAENLWQWVWQQLNSDDERLIAEMAFCYELTAAQIFSSYPKRFKDVKRIYRLQENILRRLRRRAQTQWRNE